MGPSQLFYWTVQGNGSYVGMQTFSSQVITIFLFMTSMWLVCNIPLVWKLPQAWLARREVALDGLRDTDLWLWALSAAVSVAVGLRFFGHYYIQLVPPLALLAAGALAAARGAGPTRPWRSRSSPRSGSVSPGSCTGPGCPNRTTSRCRATSPASPARTTRSSCGARYPRSTGPPGREPATRFITSPFLTGNYAGRPADEASSGADTQAAWDDFFRDFTAHPPKYFVDTSPAKVRGAQYYPISKFPRLQKIVRTQYRYKVAIDDIVVYERK